MLIREATPADDAAIVALWAACYPFMLSTEAMVRARDEGAPPEEHRLTLVAEIDGKVVGFGLSRVDLEAAADDVAMMQVMVFPEFRRRGVGSGLYERLNAHLREVGMGRIFARAFEADGIAFGASRGLMTSRTERISRVDPRTVPEPPALPDGLTLRAIAELDDLHPVYELDAEVSTDVPGDVPFKPWSYEEWRRVIVDTPIFDADCTVVAFDGDTAVAFACVDSAGSRVFSGLAGTRRAYRGRGLAQILKAHALRRAAEKGVTDAYTNNDATNAPMLAVNKRLGYEPHIDQSLLTGAI